MNGEPNAFKAEVVIFPMKPREKEVSEVKSVRIGETPVPEVEIAPKEKRFARLKRSIRKRSAAIL